MRTTIYFFGLFFLFPAQYLYAQSSKTSRQAVREERRNFVRELKNTSVDSSIVHPVANFFDTEMGKVHAGIRTNAKLNEKEEDKAARSIVFFIQELKKNLRQGKIYLYEIPGIIETYSATLKALLNRKPVDELFAKLDPRHIQLIVSAFGQYKEFSLLEDISVYKRVASSPEFILQFLENKPGFRYTDSLLVEAASYDPMKIVAYLNRGKAGIRENLLQNKNIYLRQIVSLSGDKYASELVPFVESLAERKITPGEILNKRKDATNYFQLMVNTLRGSKLPGESSSVFLNALRRGIREKSLSFYVNQVNELHNEPDAARFVSVKDLRPEDLYYIITSAGEELYTSSYLGLYKRLMEHFKGKPADSLFQIVRYDNFRVFIRLAANYNVLSDYLRSMPAESRRQLMKRFIAGIGNETGSGLERAMDIADCFSAVVSDPEISGLMQAELQANLNYARQGHRYLAIRLYSILLEILDGVKQNNGKLWAKLGNYEILKHEALQNKKGEIIQLVLFYGDEDGVSSFNNFLRMYADNRKWEITKNEEWVNIRSLANPSLVIYANRPLETSEELDMKAQDNLVAYLQQRSHEPVILVHRGHSYHLDKTLKRLEPSVKLAILGSCGGYNKALSIASINPDVQVIGSKKTGAKSINDPIIDIIDEALVNKNDLEWNVIWKKLSDRFRADKETLSLFNEYFPPGKNLSLFVLKLFNYYSGVVSNNFSA